MESFSFIESALVFALKDPNALSRFKFSPDDFSLHKNAFLFVIEYYDQHKEFPINALLLEKFDTLDKNAVGANLDYCMDVFRKQIMYRKTVEAIKTHQFLLKEDPQAAITKIMDGLSDVSIVFDEDVVSYGLNAENRISDYIQKNEQRQRGLKIFGIPTNLKTLNRTGIGWLPGDVASVFARPGVGKSWFCIKAASVAIMSGYRTLLVTSEMPAKQMELRMDVVLANMNRFNISHTALRRGDGLDVEKYKEFLEKVKPLTQDLLICDHIGQSAISIAGINYLVRKHKPDFVVIDGIHLISNEMKTSATWEKMFNLFYSVKNMAVVQKISCMLSTQANRSASDVFSPPKPHEVAYGDALMQASDVVMSMCKVEENENARLLQFLKYRDGEMPPDQVALDWNVDRGLVRERNVANGAEDASE